MKKTKGKILVVDDERSMREILEIFLKSEGYSVLVANNGESAMETMKHDHFDLIITDMKMPVMGGIELMEKVKELHPDLEVMIITGFGSIETAVDAIRRVAWDFISKRPDKSSENPYELNVDQYKQLDDSSMKITVLLYVN